MDMKKVFALLTLLTFSITSFGQEAAPVSSFWDDPFKDPMFPLYMLAGFIFVVAFLVVVVAVKILQVLNLFIRKTAEERAAKLGIQYVPEQSAWSKSWMWINGLRPMEKESELLLDHNYDGITELDNHLPPWWKWLFYITVVWGVVYFIAYHVTDSLPLMDQEYQNEVALAQEQKAKMLALNPPVAIDENSLKYEKNDEFIKKGRQVFAINCASCHGADGQGGIGPNFTDEFWIHGGSIKDIFGTIKNGVQEKGMIPWGPVLSPEQIRNVSFYIKSINGTTPANPKAPQGTKYTEEATPAVPADSVKSSI
jgi:cytochrome c oxidase cbb3-type subunit 3